MALNIEVFESEETFTYYVCFNHSDLYKLNATEAPHPLALDIFLGEYGIGSDLCLTNYRLGRQMLWDEVPLVSKHKILDRLNTKYIRL